MIEYSPGHYHVSYAWSIAGSVLPRSFLVGLPSGILTIILHRLMRTVWYESFGLEAPSKISVLMEPQEFGAYVISSFMFVLGFLIVFRAQTAYSRWWEGASLLLRMDADWSHAFSSSMALCTDKEDKAKEVLNFRHQLLRLVSLLFGVARAEICCLPEASMEIIGVEDFDQEHFKYLDLVHNKSEVVMQWIQKLIVQATNDGIIVAPPPVLARIYNQLCAGMTCYCEARKIVEFPMPFPVAQMIAFCLAFQVIIVIIVGSVSIAAEGWAGMLVFLVVSCLWGINYIATELEMPFGNDPNDIPLIDKQRDVNASLLSLVHPLSLKTPKFGIQLQSDREVDFHTTKCILTHHFEDGTLTLDHEPQEADAHKVHLHSLPVPAHFHHSRRMIGKHGVLKRKLRSTSKQAEEVAAVKKKPELPLMDATHSMSNPIDAAQNQIHTFQHISQDLEAAQRSSAEEPNHIRAASGDGIDLIIPQDTAEDGVVSYSC